MDPEGQPDPFEPENWAQNWVEPKKTGWVWPHLEGEPDPTGGQSTNSGAKDDLRVTLNKDVEITQDNIDSIINVINVTNAPVTDDEEANKIEYLNNLKLSPKTWPRPHQLAVHERRDESRPFTLPSPLPVRNDPEMIPQTPPRVEKTKKTHSPITYIQDEAPKIPIRDRLGDRHATTSTYDPRRETPRRPIRTIRTLRDRLGPKPTTSRRPVKERLEDAYRRRSKRKVQIEPFKWGSAPKSCSETEFNRVLWDHGPDGNWYPVQDEEEDSDEPSEQEEK